MKRYCECGCGGEIVWKEHHNYRKTLVLYIHGHSSRGKTLEERFGIEKAKTLRKKLKIYKKGKTFEEQYGTEKAKNIKEKLKKTRNKGKTYEEIFGTETAKKMKEKISKNNNNKKRKGKTYEEIFGIEKAKILKQKLSIRKIKLFNIQDFEVSLIEMFNNQKQISKNDFFNNKNIKNRFGHFHTINKKLKENNLTLDSMIKQLGFNFKKRIPKFGNNETKILDEIELEKGIKLERQYFIGGKFIDGYDSLNNIAYEVDEKYHKISRIQDIIRENIIKEKIDCDFIRIKDGWK